MKNLLIISTLLLLCTACMKVDYPHRNQYMLQTQMTKPIHRPASTRSLMMQSVTAVPQFAEQNFVYRTSELQYTKDYYNSFFGMPAQQVEQLMLKSLQASKLFNHVSDDINFTKPDYVLDARITKLYADYRNSDNPEAIIAIRFNVSQPQKDHIVLTKTFAAAIPLTNKDSLSLVQAWNNGLTKIFTNLAYNLKINL